jgi:hypothetical protein
MKQLGNHKANPRKASSVVSIAAALLGALVLCQPDLAHARGGHGGGFHSGGFHGGFHGGGFHGHVTAVDHRFADVHARRQVRVLHHSVDMHHRFADIRGRHWYHGWHNGRYGWWLAGAGLAWTYYSYPWDAYCSNPAGYYPHVTQCNTTWQTVPAS